MCDIYSSSRRLSPFEPNPVEVLQIVSAPGAFQRGIDFADVADRTIDLFNRLRARRAALRARERPRLEPLRDAFQSLSAVFP